MGFAVRFSAAALADLVRLQGHLLTRTSSLEDLEIADRVVDEVEVACKAQLARTPFTYRRSGESPTRRELVIPFGANGYVALFEISGAIVFVLAVRHQLEDDYR